MRVFEFPSRTRPVLLTFWLLLASGIASSPANETTPRQDGRTWDFDDVRSIDTLSTVGRVRETVGPRPPEFPDADVDNRAIKLDGRGSRIVISPGEDEDHLQFSKDDAITLTAWIAPRQVSGGSHRYVIGKGRTGSKGFRRDNQNWALRLTANGHRYQISFLFASASGPKSVNWHRWTSDATLRADDGWHHVAVTYRFGHPDSIRGWIDGVPTAGTWDMAGATDRSPIVDDDAVWIGSSMGGGAGSSFVGSLDGVSVQRRLADDSSIAALYRRDESVSREIHVEQPVVPVFEHVPAGRVAHRIIEGLPVEGIWPDEVDLSEATAPGLPGSVWDGEAFLADGLPMRYDSWGIRSAWKPPILLQIAADVELPAGPRRYLMRTRSLGRLWIDGKLVAETKRQEMIAPDGEEPIRPLAEPPHPGVRVKGYRQQEEIVEYQLDCDASSKVCRVVLELIVGGQRQRTETGEICVAVENTDGQSFDVLIPFQSDRGRLPLTDHDVNGALLRAGEQLDALNRQSRRLLAASEDAFWAERHRIAKQWAGEHPAPVAPSGTANTHPVDAFLHDKIRAAKASLVGDAGPNDRDRHFHETIQPLLQEHCLRCHGKAVKGGLRLDSRADMLTGGESGWAAAVPGKPDESEIVLRLQSDDESIRMPLGEPPLDEATIGAIADWIHDGAHWPDRAVDPVRLEPTETIDDAAFIRRVSLDTIGAIPDPDDVAEFLADPSPNKRVALVDRMLDDDRVADHLVSDWLDLLAENPTLLNTSLNSTGPFRYFLHDALVDRKPYDRMITELVLMRGDRHTGGSAGFALAGENDAPMAAKAHILASGLLGIDLQCARCHDSPFHSTTQEDLFSIAAMLNRKPLSVPSTSRVPDAFFEEQQRESMIEVTLAEGGSVAPKWTLARFTGVEDDDSIDPLVHTPDDPRDRLAALITAPANRRFPAVIVNRTWTRLMGAGLMPSLNDWEHDSPSHPELLDWLAHQFVISGYDIRQVMKWIMTSEAYARRPIDPVGDVASSNEYFAAPLTRRLTAEQVVDSLFSATGRDWDCEELTFVHDGRRPLSSRLTLGVPRRAWMMATLNNERDRPSLSLPKARTIVDVLQAFGWNGSRQKPIHVRESDASVLQPGVLANGVLSDSLARASLDSPLAGLAVAAETPGELLESLYLRFLSRYPTDRERELLQNELAIGFGNRIVPETERTQPSPPEPLPLVHWFNHLRPRANEIQQEHERRARVGPPADPRLRPAWRERYEDVVWSLINHDEFVWVP